MAKKSNCECGERALSESHLCWDCREDALAAVRDPVYSKLNRSDEGSEAPISNTVLRSCGAMGDS